MPATSEVLVQQTVQNKKAVGFHDEQGYLDLVKYIMENGNKRGDRTGTGVLSLFGAQSRYSLKGVYDTSCCVFVVLVKEIKSFCSEVFKCACTFKKRVACKTKKKLTMLFSPMKPRKTTDNSWHRRITKQLTT